jgi:hypothetical protein
VELNWLDALHAEATAMRITWVTDMRNRRLEVMIERLRPPRETGRHRHRGSWRESPRFRDARSAGPRIRRGRAAF